MFIRVPFVFTRVHSCSIRVPLVFIRVHSCSFVFIRVHSCSFVFIRVHLCSDLCGVLDMIVSILCEQSTVLILVHITKEMVNGYPFTISFVM